MKFSKTPLILVLALSFLNAVSAHAQAPKKNRENLQQRVDLLESQMEMMRDELVKLKSELSAENSTASEDPSAKKDEPLNKVNSAVKPTGTERTQASTPEKHLPGIDLGPVRAMPYGTIYFNAFGNSGGTNNADDPLFATPTNSGNVGNERSPDAIGTETRWSNYRARKVERSDRSGLLRWLSSGWHRRELWHCALASGTHATRLGKDFA